MIIQREIERRCWSGEQALGRLAWRNLHLGQGIKEDFPPSEERGGPKY